MIEGQSFGYNTSEWRQKIQRFFAEILPNGIYYDL